MRRTGTSLVRDSEEITLDELPSSNLSGTIWTKQVDIPLVQEMVYISDNDDTFNSGVYDILDSQTRAMIASLYKVAQRLSQATVASIHLTYLNSFIHQQFQEQDVWIEMPPVSVRDVALNVQRMGWGEPLPFPEEFSKEND